MAEGNTANENSENKINEIVKSNQKYLIPTFNNIDFVYLLLAFIILIADILTDIILIVQYSLSGEIWYRAVGTFLLVVVPESVMQIISLRWHKFDDKLSVIHYIFHICSLGLIRRYYTVLHTSFEARQRKDLLLLQRLCRLQNDLCVLMLLRSFILSAPQLIFQLYILFNPNEFIIWIGLSIGTSACSIFWSMTSYSIATRRFNSTDTVLRWSAIVLQTTWQVGMLIARFTAMVLFAFIFHFWFFLVMGVHWIGISLWTLLQENNFLWKNYIYNGIIGIVYCFSYFNICDKCSRRRVFIFYLIIITQNVACLILVVSLNFMPSVEILVVTSVLIIGGTFIGLTSLFLYFTILSPTESKSCSTLFRDVERNVKNSQKQNDLSKSTLTNANKLRTLKHLWTVDRSCMIEQSLNISFTGSPRSDDGCTDKKLLLENWIARSGTPTFASVPISQDPIEIEANNTFDDIEFHTVLNASDTSFEKSKINDSYFEKDEKLNSDKKKKKSLVNELQEEKLNNDKHKRRGICSEAEIKDGQMNDSFQEKTDEKLNSEKQKRRAICLPNEIDLEDSDDKLKTDNISLTESQKRRGICSSDQLILDFNIEPNIDDDIKLKRRPIYSVGSTLNSDLAKNLYNLKLLKCTDDNKSIYSSVKAEEYLEVASEVLSAHDYENICAVNIARERWGIRSWEGYTDIETYLHDDSTVRDRRRDTLTSTVTGTSASSDISLSDIISATPPAIPSRKPRNVRSRQDDYLDTLVYDLVDCDKRRVHFSDCNEEFEVESNVFVAKPYLVDNYGMLFPVTPSSLEPIEELEEPVLMNNESNKQKTQTQSRLVSTIDEIRRGNDTDSPRHVYHRTENIWDDEINLANNILHCKEIHKVPVSKTVVKSLWNNSNTKLTNSGIQDLREVSKELEKPKIQITNENNMVYSKENCVETVNIINSLVNLKSPKSENTEKLNNSPKKLTDLDNNYRKKKNENKPRRKFSLLREKFEPKVNKQEDLLTNSTFEMGSTVNLIDDVKSSKFTASVISKKVHWNNGLSLNDKDNSDFELGSVTISDQDCTNFIDRSTTLSTLRDKRNTFLKQVLSPPKFSNKRCYTFTNKK